MTFVSAQWLGWMILTVALFWLFPSRYRFFILAIITLAFLAIYSPASAGLLIFLTLGSYLFTRTEPVHGKNAILAIGLVVSVLVAYKLRAHTVSANDIVGAAIPLGLSYYSFRIVHYVLERYKGTVPRQPLRDYVSYLFFLPSLVVGPIHRYPAFDRDHRRHHWNAALLSEGLERILYGYVKISFLGNYLVSQVLAHHIDQIHPADGLLNQYLRIVQLSLNLYFQFSGYSDIAIGFARLLGFRIIENFNWPYFARNISEFWRRWHISLTTWCREYMYTTVFSLSRSPAAGALVTLVTIALWHEISLRYIAWGLYHGTGLVIWQQWQKVKERIPFTPPRPLRWGLEGLSIIFTVNFVWMGFVFVREPTLLDAAKLYGRFLLFWAH